MNIVVVGCGKIGAAIIENLIAEGHDVVAVDHNEQVVNDICTVYDAIGVTGNATDCNTLTEVGAANTDLFVAVTGSDEFNMLSCFLAKKMGAANTIARIRNPEYNDQSLGFLRQHLNISMSINPELLLAHELFNTLKFPSAVKIETFAHRNLEMVEFLLRAESDLCGLSLVDMRKKYNANFLVCAVSREGEVYIPSGDFVLNEGDKICIISSPAELNKLFKTLVPTRRQVKDIMIAGAGKTSYYLAKMLLAAGNSVKIIDNNKERCEELCEALKGAVIIHGDPANEEILLEEGISSADAFVALTNIDEENILLSFFASSHNVLKVVSNVNRRAFASVAEKLGLDSIFSPKKIVADVFVRYARALQNSLGSKVERLYKIMDGRAEALEFIIKSENELTGVPIKTLKFKNNVLIAGIIRKRKPIIPSGDDVIMPGDHVVILAAGHRINDITDIIK
ncbi:MAG: Trk system potassium transporter TrkA [Clostridia bacterium]|nr:Trk system potassium transporter TrkA [Clostridia bacterium]